MIQASTLHADTPSAASAGLSWISVAEGAPYFVTDTGEAWTPIGQNDGIGWVDLEGLFRRRDIAAAEAYLADLVANGVTCLRLMLEHAQVRRRYLERPAGRFAPNMVTLWDDLFALCERLGLRILLTPFDTFWAWMHWRHHPYNSRNGGVVDKPNHWLTDEHFRVAIKERLAFAVRRWGGSGALFAWDLWNEIHPAHGGDSVEGFDAFISDIGRHVRALEQELYGRSHPQTVSVFGPELTWKPHMDIAGPIFRHPALDFATIHIYEKGTIDHPEDTLAPALAMGRIVRESLAAITDGRPFLDTEHGPIHSFNDLRITLPEAFDDEYFRHMQWAHLASGGAGGGMRWPYRHPHRMTPGMRQAQRALAGFCDLVDWTRFRRKPLDVAVASGHDLAVFACGDGRQAVLWCLRRDTLGPDGRLRRDVESIAPSLRLDGVAVARATVSTWDTSTGSLLARDEVVTQSDASLRFAVGPFQADVAIAILPIDGA